MEDYYKEALTAFKKAHTIMMAVKPGPGAMQVVNAYIYISILYSLCGGLDITYSDELTITGILAIPTVKKSMDEAWWKSLYTYCSYIEKSYSYPEYVLKSADVIDPVMIALTKIFESAEIQSTDEIDGAFTIAGVYHDGKFYHNNATYFADKESNCSSDIS